jgi:hypothetical protein
MSEDHNLESRPAPAQGADRPIDLGLSEGKSLTFSPTAVAIPADAPAIGGTVPSAAPSAIAGDGMPFPSSGAVPSGGDGE